MAGGECPVFVGFVWSADSVVQEKNPISVDAICHLVSCAFHLNHLYCDHNPSVCIPSDSWKRELLPVPPADVVSAGWSDVFKYLRKLREEGISLQVGCHLFDPRAVFKRWDSVFIAVGDRTVGVGSSRDKAVARALRPLVVADEAHKAIPLAGCGVKAVGQNMMAVSAHRDSSGSAPEFIFAFDDFAARDAVILRVQVQTPSSRLLFATF